MSDRVTALRKAHPGKYQNIHVIRTNAMKYLPNYFHKGQVSQKTSTLHTFCKRVKASKNREQPMAVFVGDDDEDGGGSDDADDGDNDDDRSE